MAAVEPLRVYQLLWLLLGLVLRGRGRYEVNACVSWVDGKDGNAVGGIAGGEVFDISCLDGEDRFVVLDAHST